MSLDHESNPIPTAVKELLALFDGPLSSVQFPDVDGPALREHVAAVDAAVRDVEAAAAAWAEAKRAVDARLETLLSKAQRALAYARVYAEDKPELDAQLAALIVPKWGDPRGKGTPETVAARKRGRQKRVDVAPAKNENVVNLLPESVPPPSAVEAEAEAEAEAAE
ncbi:MAG: hypothetical protein IPK82_19300 [Polyangiaceae bacterium]|nr:hypothetical protein [Polyangiaceae bacterium]